jgi:hypothetical protein
MRVRFFALVMFSIAALLPAAHAAAQSRGNSPAAHEAHKKDNGNRLISVPEPSTIVLLGAAAGMFGIRKIWQHRRRIVSD